MDLPGYDAWKLASPDDYYDEADEDCPNCGGEGFTYDCIDGCCVDAEEGCELCERRCDWCQGNPRKKSEPDPDDLRDQRIENEQMARDYPDDGDF